MSSIPHPIAGLPADRPVTVFPAASASSRTDPAAYLNRLLHHAIREGASDLHIEPGRSGGQIRLRLDGMLATCDTLDSMHFSRLKLYIKATAGLDIAEKRLPQDGRLSFLFSQTEKIELRVSSLPTLAGEKLALRLLRSAKTRLNIDQLGYEPSQRTRYLAAIGRANGLVLVSGPTGSGKTSSLYAALACLTQRERNILSIEDPVEIPLPGLHQVQCNPRQGLDFATALRAFLRQDPDVIMIGEIRDQETAEIALQAAQTGHLVLATVHARDAPQTLQRLCQLGADPHLLADSLNLIIAQRLVRCLHDCKQAVTPSSETLRQAGLDATTCAARPTLYQARGCPQCRDGYLGRTGVYQLLAPSAALRRALNSRSAALELPWSEPQEGLREAALRKVIQGITSLDEADRVIPPHET